MYYAHFHISNLENEVLGDLSILNISLKEVAIGFL
jgi:hypothetical protein